MFLSVEHWSAARLFERLGLQAKRAKLKLSVELPEEMPLVPADAERARRVVTNLLHNAIKFTPKKGHVRITAVPGDQKVIISVSDTGVGIPAADLSRIFERFCKADQARSGSG